MKIQLQGNAEFVKLKDRVESKDTAVFQQRQAAAAAESANPSAVEQRLSQQTESTLRVFTEILQRSLTPLLQQASAVEAERYREVAREPERGYDVKSRAEGTDPAV